MDFDSAPWFACYGRTPRHLDYPAKSMYGCLEDAAKKFPHKMAYEFMGFKLSYRRFMKRVEVCARALVSRGVKKGDRVTICLPNVPQALDMVYAVNRLGAIANMVHPLSAEKEIEFCLNDSQSVLAITLDQFASKFEAVLDNVPRLKTLVITGPCDTLPAFARVYSRLKEHPPKRRLLKDCIFYREFIKGGAEAALPENDAKAEDDAVILYSGGTTGVSKGIMLSNNAFNAVGMQVMATNPMFKPGDRMLAVLPLFHGFGLGICVHTMLMSGGGAVLVPRFNLKSYAKALARKKPNFIAGVPTMFEALIHLEDVKKLNLSYLKGVYSGGDSLGRELKRRIDEFLFSHGSPVQIREGYGLTECISASCLTPFDTYKEGSIGIPLPDMYFKIVAAGTENELPAGEEGEICLSGPTVMERYVNNPEETEKVLRTHSDGKIWLHTGDLGNMDSEGYLYFHQRLKRMIVTSGYNVYPSQIEKLLDAHQAVHMSCVVGVDDPYRIKKVKAFVVLREGIEPDDVIRKKLDAYLRTSVAKYAVPREIEFRTSLPMTKMNKIDYRQLEKE